MSVRRSIIWSLIGNGVNFVSNLAVGMVLARLLTPAEFGVFAVAMATVLIVQAVAQMGADSMVIREPEVDKALLGSALLVGILQGCLIALFVVISAPVIAHWQRTVALEWVLLVLAPYPLFTAVENVLSAIWTRDLRFGRLAALLAAKSAIQAITSVGLALSGGGLASLACGTLASAALGLAVGAGGLVRRGIRPNLIHFRKFARFGGVWMLLGGVRALAIRIPELLLGRLSGMSTAGLYNRASASLDLVVRNGIDPIARVFFPFLAQSDRTGAGLAEGAIKLSTSLTALFWPLLGFFAFESKQLMLFLFGGKWVAAAPAFSWLCLWCALRLLPAGAFEVLMIRNRIKVTLQIEVLQTLLSFALVLSAASSGLTMVAAVRVVEPLVFTPILVLVLRRFAKMSVRIWVRGHVKSASLTILSLSPIVIMEQVLTNFASPFLNLLVKGLLTGSVYVTVLLVLRHPLGDELLRFARRWVVLRV